MTHVEQAESHHVSAKHVYESSVIPRDGQAPAISETLELFDRPIHTTIQQFVAASIPSNWSNWGAEVIPTIEHLKGIRSTARMHLQLCLVTESEVRTRLEDIERATTRWIKDLSDDPEKIVLVAHNLIHTRTPSSDALYNESAQYREMTTPTQ